MLNPSSSFYLTTFQWQFAKINRLVVKFYDVSSGKDLMTFFLATTFLWIGIENYTQEFVIYWVSVITIPVLSERYEAEVDYLASKGNRDVKKLDRKFD
ncbi:reticulon-like protein B14 [Andrographis paniculata]|uniref:reticulon-like protein B14 n=1 Tax=Andrographis paniculata TaxID=175694 RepID=UPI0021E957ED|nr:reticulon-like protein B14 [Andrographis paniculata]